MTNLRLDFFLRAFVVIPLEGPLVRLILRTGERLSPAELFAAGELFFSNSQLKSRRFARRSTARDRFLRRNVMSANDPQLAESVRTAKTRPMFFGFVPIGAEGTLLLNKTKIPPKELAEAKKQQGGGLIFSGVCHWDVKQSQLVFEVGHQPPTTLADQIKKTIKRDAEMMMDVVTRFDQALENEDLQQVQSPNTTAPETKPRTTEELQSEDNKRELERLKNVYAELSRQCKTALTGPNAEIVKREFGGKLQELLKVALEQINKKDIKQADLELNRLRTLLGQIPSEKAPRQDGSELLARLNGLAGPLKGLLDGPRGKRVKELIQGFDTSLKNNEFEVAGMVLNELETYLKEPSNGETTSQWSDRLKKRVGQRKVGKQLGSGGGTGVARMLESTDGEEPLVAKFARLDAPWLNNPTPEQMNELVEQRRKLLDEEAGIYIRVKDHPNICKCMGMVDLEREPGMGMEKALVMEAVDGDTLDKVQNSMLKRYKNGQVSHAQYWGTVQYMQIKTLQTLAYLEDQGLVHSDIKPENIMVDGRTGDVKIIDLGGAVEIGSDRGQHSKDWAAPEENNLSGKFDVYSTGKVVETALKDPKTTETEYTKFLEWLTNPEPDKRPSAREALAHPFLTNLLLDVEGAREVIKGGSEKLKTTLGFTQAAWDQTLSEATRLKKLAVGNEGAIRAVSEALARLGQPAAQYQNFSRETAWQEKSKAMELALGLLDQIENTSRKLQEVATPDLKDYMSSEITTVASDKSLKIKAIQGDGPPEITTADFKAKWRSIKAGAEEGVKAVVKMITEGKPDFDEAARTNLHHKQFPLKTALRKKEIDESTYRKEMAKLDPKNPECIKDEKQRLLADLAEVKKGAEKFFGFTDNFSGALADFEKAARKRDKNFDELKAKARSIGQKYFRGFVNGKHALERVSSMAAFDTRFVSTLQWRLNDLVSSIDQKKIG